MNTKTPYDIMNPLWHDNTLTIAAATALGINDTQFDGFIGYHLTNFLRKDVVPNIIPQTTVYHAPVQDVYNKIKLYITDLSYERFLNIIEKMQQRGFVHVVEQEIVKDRAMSANCEL